MQWVRSNEFDAHTSLVQAVLNAHQRALFAARGQSDPKLGSDGFDEEGGLSDIEFNPDTYPRPSYDGTILGRSQFRLRDSKTPDSHAVKSPTRLATEDARVPLKVLEVSFPGEEANVSSYAFIFIGPDMPPTAVHIQDAVYVAKQQHAAGAAHVDLSGPSIVELIKSAFGPEAVDYLSGNTCLALADAINSAEVRLS